MTLSSPWQRSDALSIVGVIRQKTWNAVAMRTTVARMQECNVVIREIFKSRVATDVLMQKTNQGVAAYITIT
jgi:hypothetical protein